MGLKLTLPGRGWFKRASMAAGVIVIFLIGYFIGTGQLSLSFWHHGLTPVATNLPAKLDYAKVDQVYKSLKENYDGQLSEDQLIDGLKHGLAEATNDPYTVYFTPKEAKAFEEELNNSFAGIGARLSKDTDGNLVVGEAIAGFPAAKAGLQAQDIIISVNGTDTSKLTLDDAITKIRGPIGSKVTLQIVRDKAQTLSFTITRQEIKLPSVTTKTLDGNIGYVQITSFSDDTTDLAQKAADQFKAAHVRGIILDLRDDPGGYLDAAVHVSSLWLPQGTLVLQEKRGSTVEDTNYALGGDELHGIPTVILINGGSASAAEITTGALHDNGAAYVIGQKSYGKGVVQQPINFSDGSILKVTIASWYRPNGKNINKLGITPDKTVTLTAAQVKAGNDTQLQAAEYYLNK